MIKAYTPHKGEKGSVIWDTITTDITELKLVEEQLKIEKERAENLIEATSDCGAYVMISGGLKRSAVKLSKICNDLRLLSSGPRCGLNEINLPKLQAGSSIMPAKVNPVIPEVVNQVCFKIIGNDVTIALAAEAGQFAEGGFQATGLAPCRI